MRRSRTFLRKSWNGRSRLARLDGEHGGQVGYRLFRPIAEKEHVVDVLWRIEDPCHPASVTGRPPHVNQRPSGTVAHTRHVRSGRTLAVSIFVLVFSKKLLENCFKNQMKNVTHLLHRGWGHQIPWTFYDPRRWNFCAAT